MKKFELEKCYKGGMSLRQLAKHFGFKNHKTISYWMDKFHIERRSFSESCKKSDSIKRKISKTLTGKKRRPLSSEHKRKLRIAQLTNIINNKNNGLPIIPNVGKYETVILDMIELCLTYPVQRQYPISRYFLDGYCPALNLAIEVDEKYHNKQKEQDMFRQTEIEKELNCTFLRVAIDG